MKVLINGICGFMGRELISLLSQNYKGLEPAVGVDSKASLLSENFNVPVFENFSMVNIPFDIIIDFSHHSATKDLVDYAKSLKKPLLIATTGQTLDEKEYIYNASKEIPVFFASNYSIGIAILINLAKTAVRALPDADIEIVESHHNRKLDAPSGTAISLFEAIKSVRNDAIKQCGRSGQSKRSKEEIGMHSLRMANVVGRHEVHVVTDTEEIVLKHEAFSRRVFAKGALDASVFLMKRGSGLYSMEDLLNEE